MTASSGPGLSLMQEGISYLAGAELPCVIVDVVRAGPGLGNIAPEQSDYFCLVTGGGHGQLSEYRPRASHPFRNGGPHRFSRSISRTAIATAVIIMPRTASLGR